MRFRGDCVDFSQRALDQGEDVEIVVKSSKQIVRAKHVIIAVPPALAAELIGFTPDLPADVRKAAKKTPVWMGEMVKAVAVYDSPFWRNHQLAGSAMSYKGPFREIHDHSGPTGDSQTGALFGFAHSGTFTHHNEEQIAEEFREPLFDGGMILEGGSIDVNGAGCLLTSEACLLNPNRNPELSRIDIERRLKDFLNVDKILWLGDGIIGDDTDGHIDDITRFVSQDTIVTAVEPDPRDENHAPLAENLRRLQSMTDQQGRAFRIVTLPMPEPVYFDDRRLPASYANFLITNGKILVPTYRSARDAEALAMLQSLFPRREAVGIDCTRLVWGLGAIHCVTQQQPWVW